MLRIFLTLILVIFLFLISACQNVKYPSGRDTSITSTPTATQQPVKANIKPKSEKKVSLTYRTVSKRIKNKYGVLMKLDFVFPVLTGNYSGIEKINNYYKAKEREYIAEKDSDYFASEGIPDNEYYLTAKYHLESKIGDVISIVGDGDSYAGGVSNPEIIGDVFNLNTGKKLEMNDIFKVKPKEYLKIIVDKVSQKIKEDQQTVEGNKYFFDDPYSGEGKEIISQYDVHNFYLTKNTLVVFYPKYALAAGAAGPQKFLIPFESISDVLAIDVNK